MNTSVGMTGCVDSESRSMPSTALTDGPNVPTPVVVMMGVSGTGKTTIGKALAARLRWSFIDGDDLHPAMNVAKMTRGEPLDDEDRWPWLADLHQVIEDHQANSVPLVLACSALKASYRQVLVGNDQGVVFVYLWAPRELIASRLHQRRGHFMPPTLLASQLDTLEPPADAIHVEVDRPVDETVETIIGQLRTAERTGLTPRGTDDAIADVSAVDG